MLMLTLSGCGYFDKPKTRPVKVLEQIDTGTFVVQFPGKEPTLFQLSNLDWERKERIKTEVDPNGQPFTFTRKTDKNWEWSLRRTKLNLPDDCLFIHVPEGGQTVTTLRRGKDGKVIRQFVNGDLSCGGIPSLRLALISSGLANLPASLSAVRPSEKLLEQEAKNKRIGLWPYWNSVEKNKRAKAQQSLFERWSQKFNDAIN